MWDTHDPWGQDTECPREPEIDLKRLSVSGSLVSDSPRGPSGNRWVGVLVSLQWVEEDEDPGVRREDPTRPGETRTTPVSFRPRILSEEEVSSVTGSGGGLGGEPDGERGGEGNGRWEGQTAGPVERFLPLVFLGSCFLG